MTVRQVLENVVGMGAFHLGVIVYGVEYSFGTEVLLVFQVMLIYHVICVCSFVENQILGRDS